MNENLSCPTCQKPVLLEWNFCPNCGFTLRERPLSTSILRQLGIYLFSFFLPPLGLGIAIKYLKQRETKAKIIGAVSVALTLLSIIIVIVSFRAVMDYYAHLLKDIGGGSFP